MVRVSAREVPNQGPRCCRDQFQRRTLWSDRTRGDPT